MVLSVLFPSTQEEQLIVSRVQQIPQVYAIAKKKVERERGRKKERKKRKKDDVKNNPKSNDPLPEQS